MKVLKYISYVIGFLLIIFCIYDLFGKPNGEIYNVDKHHHVYYKGEGLSKDDAKRVGDFLMHLGYFKPDNQIDVQISSLIDPNTYKIAYVVDKSKITPKLENAFVLISSSLADSIFSGKKIIVSLVDDHINEIKNLGFTKSLQIQEAPGDSINKN